MTNSRRKRAQSEYVCQDFRISLTSFSEYLRSSSNFSARYCRATVRLAGLVGHCLSRLSASRKPLSSFKSIILLLNHFLETAQGQCGEMIGQTVFETFYGIRP